MEIFENSTAQNTQEKSTSSQEAFPVSLFPQQEEEEVRKTIASSGQRCYELYAKSVQHGSLLRTFVESLVSTTEWYSSVCALSWKRMNTKSSRFVFQLAASKPHTKGIEYGLLPTTDANNGRRGARKNQNGHQVTLEDALAKLLPTPTTRDWKGARKPETLAKAGRTMSNTLEDSLVGTDRGMKLQPSFAAWMMGFPQNWTELPFRNGEKKV